MDVGERNKLFNYRPVLSMCLFLIAGIIFVVNIYIGGTFNIILSVLVGICLVTTITFKWIKAKELKLFKLLSIVIAFIVGVGLSVGFIEIYDEKEKYNGEYYITASVCERTSMTDKGKMIVTLDDVYAVNLETLEKSKIGGKVRLYLSECDKRTKTFALGEEVSASVELASVKLFENDRNNFSLFNRGIYVLGFGYEEDIISTNKVNASLSEKLKTKVKSTLDTYMSEDYSELAYTMLFGDKGGLDDELRASYSASGIAHLLAVSGLHVGFIVTMLSFILKLCKANRKVRFFVTTIIVFIYAYLCGFSVSIIRAFIMTTVLHYARLRMFSYDGLNSLSFSALIILLTNPLWLFDVGFQLSFLAVAGIILLAPVLTRFFKRYFHDSFASTLAVCVSAQLGTVPVLMTTFSNLSIFSVVTNLICIPIASMAFMMLFAFVILSLIIPPLGMFTYMFEFLMTLVTGISGLTGATSLMGANSLVVLMFSVALVATCILASDYLFLKQKSKKYLSLGAGVLTLVSFVMIFIL